VAFGALPLTLIQHIESHSDWKFKLRAVEDIERFMYDMPSHQKQQLMNFASSFIAFVEEHLIEDDNMRTVLAGIRILSKDIEYSTFIRIHDEERLDGREDEFDEIN
jgi:hypothetical protein